ncbi:MULTISPECIES: glyoxylate/hydroxypyruvate reductase A [unclassified Modicisalibacter]|uniref:2-hydroxyacid dehydrogenase n=1 Tax=unclassified Modicisalibacter TaxID=2679913 RepID=UPI001CCD4F90|nr:MULTISPECIES: glyoxylate/hydroxypyruvate reductase A [unclassified Modicisalibacter]MBZ9559894.1 glyoxylate/hydroxypyruvate reductase A [Modicisalibacter sp. R2A 31.J]MBZ9577346.1 glyoxylate/hydroxypyruvate reductase A [Modicisalibacter sp. MOD 31.J]
MRVVVHTDDADTWCQALARRLPDAEIVTSEAAGDAPADYLAVWKPPASLFEGQSRLKGIVNLGAGVDALLHNPGLPRGVPIVKLRDAGMAPLMADYVRFGVLYFQRDFDRYFAQQTHGTWLEQPLIDKADWPIGVLGLGAIGAHVARALAEDGFPVHGWSRSAKSLDGVTCHHGEAGLSDLLAGVRTLVTLLPDTDSTRGIVNAGTLSRLPEGATLINPGRGSLIDEAALLDALGPGDKEGRLRGALLDAFTEEPLPRDNPLWDHPRVRITPHMAAPTPVRDAADQVAELIRALDAGEDVETIDPGAGY